MRFNHRTVSRFYMRDQYAIFTAYTDDNIESVVVSGSFWIPQPELLLDHSNLDERCTWPSGEHGEDCGAVPNWVNLYVDEEIPIPSFLCNTHMHDFVIDQVVLAVTPAREVGRV